MIVSTEPALIYGPKHRWRWIAAFVLIVLGLAVLAAAGGATRSPQPPASLAPTAGLQRLALYGVLFGFGGFVMVLFAIRGAPRVTISADGLVLRSLFRTRRFAWTGLGPFTVIAADKGSRRERMFIASAPITGRRGGTLKLRDAFNVPLATVMGAVARYHGGIAEGTAAVTEAPTRAMGVPGFRVPWLTASLLAVFVAIFVLEQVLAITPGSPGLSPSVITLTGLGGLSGTLIRSGQWFRLFSAPFLHAGLGHLLGNAVAFVLAGYSLERATGRAWTFAVFTLGAVAGSGMSLLLASGPSVVSVGASGAIMAMLVCLFVISFRLPAGRFKRTAQWQSARIAIPALVPFGHAAAGLHIDYGAHFGGSLMGLALGLFLVWSWSEDQPLPRGRLPALIVALAGLVGFLGSGIDVAHGYGRYAAARAGSIPASEMPHTGAEIVSKADRLLTTYPRDPVAYYFAAAASLQRRDGVTAERLLKAGLALVTAEPLRATATVANDLRGVLALTLHDEGRMAEARSIAHDPCLATGDQAPAAPIAALLAKNQLCDAVVPAPGR